MTTVSELLERIKIELVSQGHKKIIRLELSSIMFFKAIKLVQFCLRDKEDEPYRNVEADPKWKRFVVDINEKRFLVIRK